MSNYKIKGSYEPKGLYKPHFHLGGEDLFRIDRIHHVEIWTGNAKQSAFFYRQSYGFKMTAYAGPETGVRDRVSYVLEQGDIRLVLSAPLGPDSEITRHYVKHGDGVAMVAYKVPDARKAYDILLERGAEPELTPTKFSDDNGEVVISGIQAFGDTAYRFVSDDNYKGVFLPDYEPREDPIRFLSPGALTYVDHMVTNVEDGRMEHWVNWYQKVLDFKVLAHFDEKDISTEYSSLRSKVMTNNDGVVKIPINEPAEGRMKSQIQEYIDYYKTPGVQHLAMATDDIITTIRQMKASGVEFLPIPDSYYEDLLDRVGPIDEDIEILRELGILVDKDDKGYLLQLFTKPVEDRPTLFYEIIQRKGSLSFGKGNFKALFVAMEDEQRRRGNL